jgi:molybdate transport system regulatory protein
MSEFDPATAELRLRLVLREGVMIGPGKAELLAQIAATGSISAAGRAMGMSYKRAWQLVEELNGMFAAPLVASARGGAGGGGAHLTDEGARLLSLYRQIVSRARGAGAEAIAEIGRMLPDVPAQT